MLLDDITESDDSIAVVSMLFDFEANLYVFALPLNTSFFNMGCL